MPFSSPGPRQNPSSPWGCWAKWRQFPEKGSWCAGSKALGSEKSFDCAMPDAGYTLAI